MVELIKAGKCGQSQAAPAVGEVGVVFGMQVTEAKRKNLSWKAANTGSWAGRR